MATIRHLATLSPRSLEGDRPLDPLGFDADTRQALMADDMLAGQSVCGVLIAIVAGGLILGIIAVLLAS
jgi:hypothetical protein